MSLVINYFSLKLLEFFQVLGTEYIGPAYVDKNGLPYTYDAMLPARDSVKMVPPYVEAAIEAARGGVLRRRVALVTDNLNFATRTAISLIRECTTVWPNESDRYYNKAVSYQKSAENLRVIFLPKAENQILDTNGINPGILQGASCWDRLFVGMRECVNKESMIYALETAGGRVQFLMVNKGDLESDWFEALIRHEPTMIIDINEPDNDYYCSIINMLMEGSSASFDEALTPEYVVNYTRNRHGASTCEEDIAWELDRARRAAKSDNRIILKKEDFR